MINGEEVIAGAELTMYLGGGNSDTLSLSPLQLAIVIKILGLSLETETGDIACSSDEMLKLKGNPLRLREVD